MILQYLITISRIISIFYYIIITEILWYLKFSLWFVKTATKSIKLFWWYVLVKDTDFYYYDPPKNI